MDFPVFVSLFLSLTIQSADLDPQPWSAPASGVIINSDIVAEPSQQPASLPSILEEKTEPVQLQPLQPSEGTFGNPTKMEERPLGLHSLSEENAPLQELAPLESLKDTEAATPMNQLPMTQLPMTKQPKTQLPAMSQAPVTSQTPAMVQPRELSVTSGDLKQLIRDSIAIPQHDSRIAGRPLRLLDVLSHPIVLQPQPKPRTRQSMARQAGAALLGVQPSPNVQTAFTGAMLFKDPQQEQKRIVSYWELAQSLGQYNLFRQVSDFWESVSALPGDEALLRTARGSARSSLCEARVALVADQYTLMETAGLVPEEGLPLPSDPPHVGTYFTYFDKLFAGKPAPALGRRLDATLPLCREAVESRACSTLAAHNAVELLAKEYATGRCTFAKLAAAVASWRAEHRAFLQAAYVYNHDICKYVVSVAGLPADRETLVMMLIRPTYSLQQETPAQSVTQPASAVVRAEAQTPAVAKPEAANSVISGSVAGGTASTGGRVVVDKSNYYRKPSYPEQTPTLAPPREDRAVQPVSGELPILESTPTTMPVQPTQSPDAPRLLPVR